MKLKFNLGLVLMVALGVGCGDDDGPADGATADTSTMDSTTGDTGGDDGATDDTGGTDGAMDDAPMSDGAMDDAPMDDAPMSDASTACRSNEDCGRQYCAGETCDGEGTCEPRPEACEDIFMPVCGCDGVDYGNACEAAAAGARVASDGMCPTTMCRLDPRMDGCCFRDRDCGRGTVCRQAACVRGGEGTCVPEPSDRECWVDSDCGPGTVCVGAVQCPCGALCIRPDAPGTCGDATDPGGA